MNKIIGIIIVVAFVAILGGYVVFSQIGSSPTDGSSTSPQPTVTTPAGTGSLSHPKLLHK